jgi:hypothetical protein
MRTILIIVALLFASAVIAQTNWIKFSPDGGGFEVMLPNPPKEQIETKKNFTSHTFSSVLDRNVFIVSYSDYNSPTTDPQKHLEANRDDFNKNLYAKPLTSRNITLDGQAGIEFTSETPAANVRSRIYLVGDRLYQLVNMTFKDSVDEKSGVVFFDSFHFVKKPNVLLRPGDSKHSHIVVSSFALQGTQDDPPQSPTSLPLPFFRHQ